jgi:hypothetical protein
VVGSAGVFPELAQIGDRLVKSITGDTEQHLEGVAVFRDQVAGCHVSRFDEFADGYEFVDDIEEAPVDVPLVMCALPCPPPGRDRRSGCGIATPAPYRTVGSGRREAFDGFALDPEINARLETKSGQVRPAQSENLICD